MTVPSQSLRECLPSPGSAFDFDGGNEGGGSGMWGRGERGWGSGGGSKTVLMTQRGGWGEWVTTQHSLTHNSDHAPCPVVVIFPLVPHIQTLNMSEHITREEDEDGSDSDYHPSDPGIDCELSSDFPELPPGGKYYKWSVRTTCPLTSLSNLI